MRPYCMKFKELIDKYTWDDVWAALIRLYPDQEKSLDGYRYVFATLRTLQPAESQMRICLADVPERDGESYTDVSGRNGSLRKDNNPEIYKDDEIGNQEEVWGLDFVDWAEWLSMTIDPGTLARYPEAEILAHCLWEMTFYGYTPEDIRKKTEELDRAVESKDWVSAEEVWKALEMEEDDG